jgi:hypothetical protein
MFEQRDVKLSKAKIGQGINQLFLSYKDYLTHF